MRADVVRALMLDDSRDGNCRMMQWGACQWVSDPESVGAAAALVLNFKCRIRELWTNPLL